MIRGASDVVIGLILIKDDKHKANTTKKTKDEDSEKSDSWQGKGKEHGVLGGKGLKKG